MVPSASLSGTVGDTTLTVEQMPSHTHTASYGGVYDVQGNNLRVSRNLATNTGATGGSQPHTHTLSGASGETNGLPPYYALAYIMRTS